MLVCQIPCARVLQYLTPQGTPRCCKLWQTQLSLLTLAYKAAPNAHHTLLPALPDSAQPVGPWLGSCSITCCCLLPRLSLTCWPAGCACGEDALQQLTGDVNAVLAITPLLSGQSSVPLQQVGRTC